MEPVGSYLQGLGPWDFGFSYQGFGTLDNDSCAHLWRAVLTVSFPSAMSQFQPGSPKPYTPIYICPKP